MLQKSPVQIWGPEAALIYSTGAYGITPAGPPRREEAIGHCGWHWPQYPAWVIACLLWVPRSRQSIGSGRSLRVVGSVIYALKGMTDRGDRQQLPPGGLTLKEGETSRGPSWTGGDARCSSTLKELM